MIALAVLCCSLPAFWLGLRVSPLLNRQAALRAQGWL